MKQKRIILAVLMSLCTLLGASVLSSAKARDMRVVYDRNGCALVLYGGDKTCSVPAYSLRSESVVGSRESLLATMSYRLRDTGSTPYGDGVVAIGFGSTAEVYDGIFSGDDWVEVSGTTQSGWMGNSPQGLSDEIALYEQWTFKFEWLDILQFPVGGDFESGYNYISFEHEDTSGNYWYMTHYYSGLWALGNSPNKVIQYSSTKHTFTSAGLAVVTAAAHDYENI